MDLVCLQETKFKEMNKVMARSLGVGCFLDWRALNAEGTAGGILLLWDNRRISLVDSVIGSFSVSRLFRMAEDGFNGFFLGCMAWLRGVLRNFSGKSLVQLEACGKNHGV